MLACSPYKFFAPHCGALYGRASLLAALPCDKLDVADDGLPAPANCGMSRWELGTQNFEALAGAAAAVDYLAERGSRFGGADGDASRRQRLAAAWRAVGAHEDELKARFLVGAAAMRGVRVLGVTDTTRLHQRTPTFAVEKEGLAAAALAEAFCAQGIWCTAGNHYATFWAAQSGGSTSDVDGMTRLGLLHYNTLEEVDRILEALERAA
jgi:selenocysteine lyase/cysteine desulfurase